MLNFGWDVGPLFPHKPLLSNQPLNTCRIDSVSYGFDLECAVWLDFLCVYNFYDLLVDLNIYKNKISNINSREAA